MDVFANFRQRGKQDQPPKLLCDIKVAQKRRYLIFFLENAQNLGRSDDAKRRKKGGWPKLKVNKRNHFCPTPNFSLMFGVNSKNRKSYNECNLSGTFETSRVTMYPEMHEQAQTLFLLLYTLHCTYKVEKAAGPFP